MTSTLNMALRESCQLCLVANEILSKCAVVSLKTPSSFCRRMASSSTATNTKSAHAQEAKLSQFVTPIEEARRFMVDCFKAAGTPQEHAETVADNLVEADYRGHYSHGMNRLEMYIRDIQGGMCDPKATCSIDKETVATALVDGKNGMGAVVGKYCMNLAIKKAKDVGIAMVVAHGSNHYGIAGMYALQAINEGLLGMSFTNTSPFMAPTRAKQAALGTNPISLGAPAQNGDSFVLDMATTAVAVGKEIQIADCKVNDVTNPLQLYIPQTFPIGQGRYGILVMTSTSAISSNNNASALSADIKIELARRKGTPIPEGWALNDHGEVETDPDVAYKAAKLMPVGGAEVNSGYKGYGLGVLVEVFCGMLSGSKYGPFVRKWGSHGELANLGQAFIAINPKCFAEGFEERMSDLMNYLRNMEPADPTKPVLVHGDPERIHMEKVKRDGGFLYVQNQHDTNEKLAEELNVRPMVSNKIL